MIEFTSNKTVPILMLDQYGQLLLTMMQTSGIIPSALTKNDLPKAILELKTALAEVLIQKDQQKKIKNSTPKTHDRFDLAWDKWQTDEISDCANDAINDTKQIDLIALYRIGMMLLEMLEITYQKEGLIEWKYV